jgi:hypothetical protein
MLLKRISLFKFFVNTILLKIFRFPEAAGMDARQPLKNSIFMAHNVSAVYDVFAARIRALRSKDQGCKNVAEFWRGNGA